MRYDYECSDCGHQLYNVEQSVKDEPLKVCPKCGGELERVILDAPMGFVEQEPTTVGHLADRNTKKMGKYELEAKRQQNTKPEPDTPWYGSASKKVQQKMIDGDKDGVTKYIMEGKE